jgi:hypothetical protein
MRFTTSVRGSLSLLQVLGRGASVPSTYWERRAQVPSTVLGAGGAHVPSTVPACCGPGYVPRAKLFERHSAPRTGTAWHLRHPAPSTVLGTQAPSIRHYTVRHTA